MSGGVLAFMFSEVYHDSHLTPKDRIAALSSKRNRAKLRKGRFGEGKKDFCPTSSIKGKLQVHNIIY